MASILRLVLVGILGLWITACDLSQTPQSDTLDFRLDDSLKTGSGKYDSVRLDLYAVSGKDTTYARTVFHGEYLDSNQLRNLPLGGNLDGIFLIRVIAYREDSAVLEVGVPFSHGEAVGKPIVYRAPEMDPSGPHSPSIISGMHDLTMDSGESRRIVLRARDEDGDPIHFEILNLDSLRALFPSDAIRISAGGDSLTFAFAPGSITGDFPFRIALIDPVLSPVIRTLTISVSGADRPPTLAVQGPGSGENFLLKEGETLSLRIKAQDPDPGDTAILMTLGNAPWPGCGNGKYDTASGILSFTPSFQCVLTGETTFTPWIFKAMDKANPPRESQVSVRITVQDSNSAPRWKSSSLSVAGKEGEAMGLDLSNLFLGDDENDAVEFAATCGSVDAKTLLWGFSPGFRDAGTMECEIAAKDAHLPPATAKLVLKLTIADSVRPVDVAIVSPIHRSSTRDSLVVVKWKVGDQWQFQDTLELLHKEGPNIIRRSYKDSTGRTGSDSILVFRDTEAPSAPIVGSSLPTPTHDSRPSWVWKSGGKGGAGFYRWKLEDTLWASGGNQGGANAFVPGEALSEGAHTLYVEERDSAGNWSGAGRFSIETDYTPPNPPTLASSGFHTQEPKPTWNWASGGNGGSGTFRMKLDDPGLGAGSTITTATSYAPTIGFASGTKHTLYLQERDEAGNWSEPVSYGVRVHGQTGFVVGDKGLIMRTTNAGGAWDSIPRTSDVYFKSAWFLDANTGFVAGDYGKIIRTIVGGTRWSSANSGTSATISSLCFVSDRLGYAATESGEVRVTGDGGETWSPLSAPTTYGISGISFADSLNGLAVGGFAFGARGFILSSKDGGKTWAKPLSDAPYALMGITFVNPEKGFAVGNNGAILVSTDSGSTWKEVPSGTTNYLTSVFFVSETTGFITGDQGTILKTMDGGESWKPLATGTGVWLSSVYFTDDRTGYATGAEATILRTTDGGANWSVLTGLVTFSETQGNIGWMMHPMFSSVYFP